MAHVRQSIRDNVVTAVTGLTTTGTKVFRNMRPDPWAVLSTKRPVCIAANNGSEFEESRHIANAYIDRKHFRTASREVLATAGS